MSDIHTVHATLLSLIYPMGEGGMSAEQIRAMDQAAELQIQYEESGGGSAVKSRSVGDVSVTYAEQTAGMNVNGRQISPAALAVLKNAGLLCRWV